MEQMFQNVYFLLNVTYDTEPEKVKSNKNIDFYQEEWTLVA